MNFILGQIKKQPKAIPCLFYPLIKTSSSSVAEILTDSAKQSQLLIKIAETYPLGAVIRMTELWCEASAFGMECHFQDNDFPRLDNPRYNCLADLEKAVSPQVDNAATGPLIEAVRLASPKLNKPLIVGVTGPYTLASVLNGSSDFMMNCVQNKDVAENFLEMLTAFLIKYIAAYKAAGASAIILAEPSTCMISPKMMEKFSNKYIQKIIDAAQDGNFSIIYHNCGAVTKHLEVIAKLNCDGFHFGNEVDLTLALNTIAGDRLVMGNLDPRLFIAGKPAEIKQMTAELLTNYSSYDNWRPSTGCDLSPEASIANIESFILSI